MKRETSVLADTPPERWHQMRHTLLERLWKGLVVLALLGAPASASRAFFTGWQQLYTIHVVLALVLVVVYIFRTRIPFGAKAAVVVLLPYGVGVAGVFTLGLLGRGLWWLVLSSLLASILYSVRAGIVLSVVTSLLVVAAGAGFVSGALTIAVDVVQAHLVHASSWATMLVGAVLAPLIRRLPCDCDLSAGDARSAGGSGTGARAEDGRHCPTGTSAG